MQRIFRKLTDYMEHYIELKVPIRNDAKWFKALKEKLSERGLKVKWQNAYYHITLVFITEIVSKKGRSILYAPNSCLRYAAAPHLTFDKLDAFTSHSGDHIIHLTSSCPSKEFNDLVNSVRQAIDEAGWKHEPEFRLHVTLGRMPSGQISHEDLLAIIREVQLPAFTLQLSEARFMKRENHEVLESYHLYPDEDSAQKAMEERRRRAFMNAFSNFQLFADPDF